MLAEAQAYPSNDQCCQQRGRERASDGAFAKKVGDPHAAQHGVRHTASEVADALDYHVAADDAAGDAGQYACSQGMLQKRVGGEGVEECAHGLASAAQAALCGMSCTGMPYIFSMTSVPIGTGWWHNRVRLRQATRVT